MSKQKNEENFLQTLKRGVWTLGIGSWIFGISDKPIGITSLRTLASFADGYVSAIDLIQLCTASFFFVSWLFLKPE